MSYHIGNKLAMRRAYGVERLVRYDRRGNLNTEQVFHAIFIV